MKLFCILTGLSLSNCWEAIQEMNSDEINLILGTEMALKQMENDENARAMAASKASSMHKSMGVNF